MEATTTLADQMLSGADPVEGAVFTTRARTITESDLVAFAGLTGDWHPQHTDAVYAADSIFGERVAHGMLVLSYAVGLVPFDPRRVVALRRIGDVRFLRPVRIGDTVAVRVKIGELRPIRVLLLRTSEIDRGLTQKPPPDMLEIVRRKWRMAVEEGRPDARLFEGAGFD